MNGGDLLKIRPSFHFIFQTNELVGRRQSLKAETNSLLLLAFPYCRGDEQSRLCYLSLAARAYIFLTEKRNPLFSNKENSYDSYNLKPAQRQK